MLDKLFEPARIGALNLRNRIVMPAMVVKFANSDGCVSEDCKAYYAERAKGGVALIIVESTAVVSSGRSSPLMLRIDGDDVIAGFRSLTDEIHRYGAKAAIQLVHCGRQGRSEFTGQQLVAPSAIPYAQKEAPRELSAEEIEGLVGSFAEAARRAQQAGFDAIEIHGAHGYLINEFLSSRTNKRSDKYGGDLAGRTRFAVEVVKQARAKVGNDFTLLFRISADEYLPGGLTLNESCAIAWILQEAGIDCFNVSAGTHESLDMFIQPALLPPGCLVHLAAGIKNAADVPVVTAGRIGDILLAESILRQGQADLIAMGRALITDPELPNKAREGRLDEIRPCLACRECSYRVGGLQTRAACPVNAGFGQEGKYTIIPAQRRKKVLVVGGGPAGLEAARIAALRGHQVILYEQEGRLGGQLQLACVPPHKQAISLLIKSLVAQVTKLGVGLHVGTKVTPELAFKVKPDAIVVATGSVPILPEIPGVQGANVFLAGDILAGKKVSGDRAIVIGGGQVGCETADFLAAISKRVTIVEVMNDVASDMIPMAREPLLKRLRDMGVSIYTNTSVREITDSGVVARTNDKDVRLDAESVIVAVGCRSNDGLVKQLAGETVELHVIGDCVEPRSIFEAIHEGFQVGLEV